ncbi:MAG: hypothetical protein J5858_05020 [Lentisphaeria bacterium]|nr:hypothetical protein [Lentisphaeria bacterium]
MRSWSRELTEAVSGTRCELLFGLPAYDDSGVEYHDPKVENLSSALSGCAATGREVREEFCRIRDLLRSPLHTVKRRQPDNSAGLELATGEKR